MTATSLNEVYKAIGTLTAEVSALRQDLKDSETRNAESNRKADESRANVHRRLDEVVMRTTHLETDVVSVKGTVGDMQKVTDEVKQWKQRGIGALAIVGFGASSLTWIVTYYFDAIVRMLSKH